MMDIAAARKRTLCFLKRYGHLDDPDRPPDFRAEDSDGYVLPIAIKQPWLMDDPNYCMPATSGDTTYKNEFNSIMGGIQKRTEKELRKMPLGDVQDSSEFVLIDTGSGPYLGRRTTRPFARLRPNVKVYMIDDLAPENLMDRENYKRYPRNDLAGEELSVRIMPSGNVEDDANRLLEANGYHNVRYIQRRLIDPKGGTNLGDIESDIKGKRIVITGFRNPKELGTITLLEGIYHGAERIYMNNTAVERIQPDSGGFDALKSYLNFDLTDGEMKKLISLVNGNPRDKSGNYRYDTNERCFAVALKQLFSLSQAEILENNGYDPGMAFDPSSHVYNQADQNFAAIRLAV